MLSNKLATSGLNQHSQFDINANVQVSKMTMSAVGKNQNFNNERWAETIRLYYDDLIRH